MKRLFSAASLLLVAGVARRFFSKRILRKRPRHPAHARTLAVRRGTGDGAASWLYTPRKARPRARPVCLSYLQKGRRSAARLASGREMTECLFKPIPKRRPPRRFSSGGRALKLAVVSAQRHCFLPCVHTPGRTRQTGCVFYCRANRVSLSESAFFHRRQHGSSTAAFAQRRSWAAF